MALDSAKPARENSFDLIRLLLAMAVVYSHTILLGGFGQEWFEAQTRMQTSAGSFGVVGFFGLSGFLITQSWRVNPSLRTFLAARLLRIMPAFLAVVVLCAFVFAPAISWFSPAENSWSASEAIRYVVSNAWVKVGSWHVGDELLGLPYPESLNGPTWSLWPELICYSAVAVLGLSGALGDRLGTVALLMLGLVMFHAGLVLVPTAPDGAPTVISLNGFSPLFLAFATGAALSLARDQVVWSLPQAIVWVLVTLVILRFGGWHLFGPMALTMALIQLAVSTRIRIPFDASYGTYLLHFPVIHLLASMGLNQHGFIPFLAASAAATLLLAVISWFLIEKPSLGLKRRFSIPKQAG